LEEGVATSSLGSPQRKRWMIEILGGESAKPHEPLYLTEKQESYGESVEGF
jgi:hypothetical protein